MLSPRRPPISRNQSVDGKLWLIENTVLHFFCSYFISQQTIFVEFPRNDNVFASHLFSAQYIHFFPFCPRALWLRLIFGHFVQSPVTLSKSSLFYYTPLPHCCPRWSTLKRSVRLRCFWLSHSGTCLLGPAKLAEAVVFIWTTEQTLSVYSFSSSAHFTHIFVLFLTTFSLDKDWFSLSKAWSMCEYF